MLPAFSVHVCPKPKSKMVPTSTMMPSGLILLAR
jgi:hypothetical protein